MHEDVKQGWDGRVVKTNYFLASIASISRKLPEIRPKLLFMTNRKLNMRAVLATYSSPVID